ncbi:MAG TPA: ABC transporter ATP-binding protein [Anaerohalosphaeraceae bacterium]|nr:ABC transporter ATP-binding protein [Phycisphaerae bacterium]HOK97017.1 ABC transporter ATP-binding protein [Anaerohalosphaeraceae bacterium]HOL31650.1 ABC transporter ATP-binding protein [Anaerohalosphaeraceae bacterium]HOM76788.1 ABC transporter ATP-binding protein [Anaerohalosphaeraceae bacterium]HPC64981.1 ABC transporter ATP-binding protein [Anaerohalosphaeraceae bacterium]
MTKKPIQPQDGILVTLNLTKRFEDQLVFDSISLAIEEGKTTVIIGPSGCGKTVFMKHLIVLERPTEGQVYFKGQRIDHLDERSLAKIRMHFGFCFQMGALFDSLTVYENITFPVRQHYKTANPRMLDELVKQKLALVGMDGFQHQYPASLSGGQRKRVALARAIALNPEVILYDEPTTGLDPITSDVINELIIKLQKELKITSVVVTHDMKSAYKIADRIVMLYNGRIIADGDADHIRNHPHDVVQQFIHGRVGEAELAALRLGGTRFETQFTPDDFK